MSSKPKKEFRTLELKVNNTDSVDNIGYLEGYASTFWNVDLGLDIIEPGAFAKTIKDKKGRFPILLEHHVDKQVGWNIEAEEDAHGLKVKGEILLVTEEAKNKYLLAKRASELETKMGLSIGFSTIKSDPDPQRPAIRRIKEVKLWEYSLVTFPMNEMAGIDSVKRTQWMDLLDKLHSDGQDLEVIIKALQSAVTGSGAAPGQPDPKILQSVDKLLKAMKA